MTLATLPRYLIGNRRAIEEIASNRWSLLIGFILVLTGGLARNYDGAYLVKEWPVLLHGPVIATVNAFVLYVLFFAAADIRKGRTPPFIGGFLSFLGLFWMTAPMAWLYAVPYERFLSPVDAVAANLWTLAFVSVWRVALMTRVLAVLYRANWIPSFLLVLMFADAVVFLAAHLSAAPIVDLMGGLHHSPQDHLLADVIWSVKIWSMLAILPLWAAAAVGTFWLRPEWVAPVSAAAARPRSLLCFAALCLLAWIPLCLWAQPEQRLRYRAEALLHAGRAAEGLMELSRHRRDEYPPVWDPPPRLSYGETNPDMSAVRAALAAGRYASWVEETYCDKSWRQLSEHRLWEQFIPESDREQLVAWLENPAQQGPDLDWSALRFHADHDPRLTPVQCRRLQDVLDRHSTNPTPAESQEPPR